MSANMPGRIAASASLLYAKNLYAFLETMVDKETKALSLNPDDELVKATLLTHAGKVVHPAFAAQTPPDAETAKAAEGTEPGLDVAPKKPAPRKASSSKAAPRKASPKSKPEGGA